MAYVRTDSQNYSDIAVAIRSKNGQTIRYKPYQMADAIAAIPSGDGNVERLSWHQCPEAVQSYLANVTYSPSDYTSSQIAIYAPATPAAANTKPIGYTTGGVTYYNEVPNEQTPFANEQTAGTLEPLDRLRLINCPTASNVRDLGGWSCDGGTVRYGLLFRGGEPTAQDAAVLVDECGVKFELNLRGRPEAQREYSILGNIGYAVFDAYAWYSISDTALWRQMLRTLFDAVNNSIPVYFHCSAGADRTGTFACILEALLGMNQSDCDKDYELTCFYTGTDTDAHGRRRDENDWKGLINQINAKEGNSFRDKVVNFVLSLGISVNDINRFRAVMIDGTPEILVNTHHTVTNTLTGVTNSNAAMTAEEHQPYTATLTPNSGKLIDSVTVTMGGTDITSQVFSGTAATRKVSVTQNLTNCKSNDPREFASVGESYILTLTADEDYTLTGATVTITMGGTDVSQYYSNGTISIPNVTGDIVITATAVASADTTIALNWNNGYNCSYTVGQSIEMTQNASYAVTDLIPVTTGKTYTVKIDGIENLKAFRFVGANSNGIVTETIEGSNGQTTIATFTPASGTTQMRLRGYSSAISDLQQFVMTES